MITIEDISTTVYRLPLHGKLQWGKHSVLNDVQHVLIKVRLSDGAEGVAEAPPRPTIYGETTHSITNIIEQELKPRIIGQSPAYDLGAMYQIKNNHTAKGAIDMAVHDARAKSEGVSLLSHLVGIGDWRYLADSGAALRPASAARPAARTVCTPRRERRISPSAGSGSDGPGPSRLGYRSSMPSSPRSRSTISTRPAGTSHWDRSSVSFRRAVACCPRSWCAQAW